MTETFNNVPVPRPITPEPDIIEETTETPGVPKVYVNIPERLRRTTDREGTDRAIFTEQRLRRLIAKYPKVETAIRHEMGSDEDKNGWDITAILKKGLPIRVVRVQGKASRSEVQTYKQGLKEKYFPTVKNPVTAELLVRELMAINRTMVLNGAETKPGREIMEDAFEPQLERILSRADGVIEQVDSGQIEIFPDPVNEQLRLFKGDPILSFQGFPITPVQVYPTAVANDPANLLPFS